MELTEKEFCELAKAFVNESGWNLTYNEERAKQSFRNFQYDDNVAFVVTRKGDDVIAAAVVVLDYLAHDEPFGYILKFYIKPEYRNGRESTKLINTCNKWFDENGAVACFCSPFAKIDDKAAEKLMKLTGYNKEISMYYRSI